VKSRCDDRNANGLPKSGILAYTHYDIYPMTRFELNMIIYFTDFINGYVAERGAFIGVPAPLHAKMNDLVHRVERGEVKPGADLIAGW